MDDAWRRLQLEFRSLMDRTIPDPPWADFKGFAKSDTAEGYTSCQVCTTGGVYTAERLTNLCQEAGELLPPELRNCIFNGKEIREATRNGCVSRWILYLASILPPDDARFNHGRGGPRVDLMFAGNAENSFSGRVYSVPAASDLAIDRILRFEASKPADPAELSLSDIVPLDENTANVLRYVAGKYPVFCTLDNISGNVRPSLTRNTATNCVETLIGVGYLQRPIGAERKGVTATPLGAEAARLLP